MTNWTWCCVWFLGTPINAGKLLCYSYASSYESKRKHWLLDCIVYIDYANGNCYGNKMFLIPVQYTCDIDDQMLKLSQEKRYMSKYIGEGKDVYHSNREAEAHHLPNHTISPVFPCVHSNIFSVKLFLILTNRI